MKNKEDFFQFYKNKIEFFDINLNHEKVNEFKDKYGCNSQIKEIISTPVLPFKAYKNKSNEYVLTFVIYQTPKIFKDFEDFARTIFNLDLEHGLLDYNDQTYNIIEFEKEFKKERMKNLANNF